MTNRLFPFSRFTVYGNSMLPALKEGREILSFNWAYLFSKPKIGDLVVMRKNGKEMVKRVQTIHGREYFVLGDNEKMSIDSRSFGMVNESEILGKVILII